MTQDAGTRRGRAGAPVRRASLGARSSSGRIGVRHAVSPVTGWSVGRGRVERGAGPERVERTRGSARRAAGRRSPGSRPGRISPASAIASLMVFPAAFIVAIGSLAADDGGVGLAERLPHRGHRRDGRHRGGRVGGVGEDREVRVGRPAPGRRSWPAAAVPSKRVIMASSLLTPLLTNSCANALFLPFAATMKACAPMNGCGRAPGPRSRGPAGWRTRSRPSSRRRRAHGPETRNAALPLVNSAIELSPLIEVRSTFCLGQLGDLLGGLDRAVLADADVLGVVAGRPRRRRRCSRRTRSGSAPCGRRRRARRPGG